MKKLLLLPTILVLVSCQPSELDRCIEANMPELNETQREDLMNEIYYSYKVVFPDETSEKKVELLLLEDGLYAVGDDITVFYLFARQEFYDSLDADEINVFGISKEIENFKNLYDYNIEYYGLSDGVDLEAYYKKTSTSVCNMQGIY